MIPVSMNLLPFNKHSGKRIIKPKGNIFKTFVLSLIFKMQTENCQYRESCINVY